jgi:hypothetical protein
MTKDDQNYEIKGNRLNCQWLQDPSKINGEASRNFRNKKREYRKTEFNELAMNRTGTSRDLYRGIN